MLQLVRTVGPANARIMLVGEAPGKEEQLTGEPFVGSSGRVLNQLLGAAGLYRQACLLTNVARQQPPGNNISIFFEDRNCTIPKPMMREWMHMLAEDIISYKPNVIVALGRTALWALTGHTKISTFRGYLCECSLVPGFKVLPTFHPRYVIENWKESFTVVMDLRKAVKESITPEMPRDQRVLIPDATLDEWIKYCNFLAEQECPVAFDIETTGNRCHTHRVGFSHNPNFGMSIGILNGTYPKYSTSDEVAFWDSVSNVLDHCPVILQNGSFDIGAIFHHVGVLPRKLYFDTHIAAHVCWPETPRSLSYLASVLLNVPAWKHTSGEDNGLYNAADCANTFGIYLGLKAELDAQGLSEVFMFEMSQIYPAVMLQLQGISIDEDRRQKIACFAQEEMDDIQEGLNRILKRDVNMRSPKQMQQLLYIDLGLPVQYKRRKSANEARTITTDATALANLERTCKHPALSLIMRYKKLDKLVSNFLDIEISPEGKVHTCYNITGATMRRESKGFVVDDEDSYRSFGRWSSSGSIILPYGPGNLQNIPKAARKIFVPPKGYVILQADYKQAEAVVVAYLINDVKMKKLFQDSFGKSDEECAANGWDIHKLTAAAMFGVPVTEVTKEQRTVGKTIRHACVDKDTEVLTRRGWVKIPDFDKDLDVVAQWNEDNTINFVTPNETVSYDYKGFLYEFLQPSLHQTVSPDHRMVVRNRKNKKLYVRYSQDLFDTKNADYKIPVAGKFIPEIAQDFDEYLLRLVVAIQADGSYRQRENKKEITFHLHKERKINRLRVILNAAGISFTETVREDSSHNFYIGGGREENIGLFALIKMTDKMFGPWVLNLTFEQLNAMVDETRWWDSRRNAGGNSWQYYSQYKENCEWVAIMCHLTNRKGTVSETHPTVFTTNISETSEVCFDKSQRNLVWYEDKIYSMQVPSSFYLIRKGNIISVTGNTNYSAGPDVVANRLGVTRKEAKAYLDKYHAGTPQLHLWHQRIRDELQRTRVLTNLFGRKHRFLDRWGDSLFRSAYSFIPQSTVGDLLNHALINIYNNLNSWCHLALQLHDAVYVYIKPHELNAAIEAMRENMLIPLYTDQGEQFTIDVDFSWGDTWGEMETVSWHPKKSQ